MSKAASSHPVQIDRFFAGPGARGDSGKTSRSSLKLDSRVCQSNPVRGCAGRNDSDRGLLCLSRNSADGRTAGSCRDGRGGRHRDASASYHASHSHTILSTG